MAQQPILSQGLLIVQASRTHMNTPYSSTLLWTSVQSVAWTSTWKHTTLTKKQTSVARAEYEPAVPGRERPQTYALDRAATGIARGDR